MFMIVDQREDRFFELKQYASTTNNDTLLVQHSVQGLNDYINDNDNVRVFETKILEFVMAKTKLVEENIVRGLGGKS